MQTERAEVKKMTGDLVKCLYTGKGKVPVYVVKTYEEMDVEILSLSTSLLEGDEWSALPLPLYPCEKPPVKEAE